MSALAPVWNTDIKSAPHGRYEIKQRREGVDIRVFVPERVILATKCGKVTVSHYIPDEKRWMMLAKGEQPVAWHPWPEHPNFHSDVRNGANAGGNDVDGSASRAGHAGQTVNALSGQVEPRNSDIENFDGNASLAAREDEKSLHSNPPSDGDAFAAVTVIDQLANANSVEPPPSDTLSLPSLPLATNGPTLPKPTPASGQPNPNDPAAAADAAGDYLREPMAAASGQIVREGDAPRETGRFGGVASSPDTEFTRRADAGSDITMTHQDIRT